MSTDPRITRETEATQGRFVFEKAGEAAELTYSLPSPGLISADHTRVPDSLSGTGAGLALVEALVAAARAEGLRIQPRCPFVAAMRQRHPDWADAFV